MWYAGESIDAEIAVARGVPRMGGGWGNSCSAVGNTVPGGEGNGRSKGAGDGALKALKGFIKKSHWLFICQPYIYTWREKINSTLKSAHHPTGRP